MNGKNIQAWIFVRGDSLGLPGKNVKPLLGKPLIAYTIEETVDVDAKKDLEYLEFYMENRETELLATNRELAETKAQMAETKAQLKSSVEMLLKAGLSIADIATNLGLTPEEVKQL